MSTQESPAPRKLFFGNLWIPYSFATAQSRFDAFMEAGRSSLSLFIHSLLLYDRVVLPTQDFLGLTVLTKQFGENALRGLLDERLLAFMRLKGSFGCARGSLTPFFINKKEGPSTPFSASTDEALAFALTAGPVTVPGRTLHTKVIAATQERNVKTLYKALNEETARDVSGSPGLRDELELEALVPNQGDLTIRIYTDPLSPAWKGDAIDRYNALAFANLELRLANEADCADSTSASPMAHLLRAKAERLGISAEHAFGTLREVAGIPDVGAAVLDGRLDLDSLLKLRRSRDGEAFRQWFHQHVRADPEAVGREYAQLLKQVPFLGTATGRMLRILATGAVGTLVSGNPLVGAGAAATVEMGASVVVDMLDSFYLERWLRKASPRSFLSSSPRRLAAKAPEHSTRGIVAH
jgi:hypothetical protein